MYRMCLTRRRETDIEPTGSDNTLLLSRTPGQARHQMVRPPPTARRPHAQ
jgi:hypothetical protein